MFELQYVRLTNYVVWPEVEFEFQPGRTFLHGDNGSGKSLLVAPIKACMYDSFDLPKGAEASFGYRDGKRSYEFTAINKGRARNSFRVLRNDADQAVETRDAAHNLQLKYWGNHIQESLFDTTVSLSGLRRHPLADGKAAQRLDWVHETLAYANQLDGYIELVEKQIKPARDAHVRHDLLRTQLAQLEPVAKPKHDKQSLLDQRQTLTTKITRCEQRLRAAEQVQEYRANTPVKPKFEVTEARARLKQAETRLERLEERYAERQRWKLQAPRAKAARTAVKQARQAYREACTANKFDPELAPRKFLAKWEPRLETLEAEVLRAQRDLERWDEQTAARELSEQTPPLDFDLAKVRKQTERQTEARALLRRTLASAQSGETVCSECGQPLAGADHDPKVLEAQLEQTQERLRKLKLTEQILTAREQKFVERPDAKALTTRVRRLGAVLTAAREYETATRIHEEFVDLTEPEFDADAYKQAQRRARQAQQDLSDAVAYRKASGLNHLIQNNPYSAKTPDEIAALIRTLARRLTELRTTLEQVTGELILAESTAALYQQYAQRRTQLEQDIEASATAAGDYRILTALRKSLGRDGFRTKRLADTLELFVDNLNDLAPLVWREPYKFELETGPRKCDVVIHRNRTRGSAFTLSGMEQRSWQLVAGLAMLKLLPSNRRCDTIVLDELEANMTQENRYRYIREFLPELQKTVPNILVVSPLTTKELGFQPDNAFRVVKSKGRSTLVSF